MMSDYNVELVDDNINELYVDFQGPHDSPYAGGTWRVRVELPDGYPYKSPSIGFGNKIYHPNVDEAGGSVCLDVINQTWSPMFDLINVFESFLPQLLLYPNPSDPLNNDAASLLLRDPSAYADKVKDYVRRYASGGVKKGDKGRAGVEDDEDGKNAGGEGGPWEESSEDGGSAENAFASSDDDDDAAGFGGMDT